LWIIKSAIEQGVRDSFSPSPNHGETTADEYSQPTSEMVDSEAPLWGARTSRAVQFWHEP